MYFQHFYDIKTDFFVMKSMSSDRLCVCVCVCEHVFASEQK